MIENIGLDEDFDLWFVSDPHFYHKKLVRSCPEHFERFRNYDTVEEMNIDIITQWNKFISPNDIVVFLGDFGLNIPVNEIEDIFINTMNGLNGKKLYIKGNHDKLIVKKNPELHWFDGIAFDYKNRHYICQHYDFNEVPIMEPVIIPDKENVLVHGHTHSSAKISIVDFAATWKMKQNCVCWDAWYRPVNYKELISIN